MRDLRASEERPPAGAGDGRPPIPPELPSAAPAQGLVIDATGRLRTIWRLAIFLAGYLVLQLVLSVAAVAVAVIVFALFDRRGAAEVAGLVGSPQLLVDLQLLIALPTAVAAALWVALCRRWLDHRPIRSLGLGRPRWGWARVTVAGAIAGASPIALSLAVLLVFEGYRTTGLSASWRTSALAVVLLFMAFAEEIVFRGYVLTSLLESGRRLTGILFSALAFAAFHALNPEVWSSPWAAINLVGAGIVLALAYLASGDLWFPTAVHLAWNVTQGVVFQLPVSGLRTDGIVDLEATGRLPDYLAGTAFGLEASVLVTAGEAVLCLAFLAIWKGRSAARPPTADP